MAGVIETQELQDLLGMPDLRIIDARMSFADYELEHIPGAQFLHVETLRLSDGGVPCKMMPVEALAIIFGRLGIEMHTPVVIYTERTKDFLSASYVAWSLAVTGQQMPRVLNGGLSKWTEEKRPLAKEFPLVYNTRYTPCFDPTLFADWQYVRDHIEDPDVQIVDTRTRSAYAGSDGFVQRRGHVPGAVLHNYTWDFHRDNTYHPLDKLRDRYVRQGITPDKEIITYCDTGREGSAVWFALKFILGYPRVRLYQASMTEWASMPDLPLVLGNQPWGEEQGRKAA